MIKLMALANGEMQADGEGSIKFTAYEANRLILLPMEYEGMPLASYGWFPLGVYMAPESPDAS